MTAPRQVLPGITYLVTRRCLQRCFLLRPCQLTNETIGFLLAVAATKYGLLVHAFCVLSNHIHLVVTDPEARLPAFSQYFDSLVARAINRALGRRETFWAPSSYSAVTLVSLEDIVAKTAYVLANPVAAGLVPEARLWPGLWSDPAAIGGEHLVFEKPGPFFRKKGRLPARAELALVPPPACPDSGRFRELVESELAAAVARANADSAAAGKGFVPMERILTLSPFDSPSSLEPPRVLNPRIACLDKGTRRDALSKLKAFIEDYRAALKLWRRGLLAVFPAGTYLVRLTHNVPCAATG